MDPGIGKPNIISDWRVGGVSLTIDHHLKMQSLVDYGSRILKQSDLEIKGEQVEVWWPTPLSTK